MGLIVSSASSATENGNINYIQKSISGEDDKLDIDEQRIYFGLETNNLTISNLYKNYLLTGSTLIDLAISTNIEVSIVLLVK